MPDDLTEHMKEEMMKTVEQMENATTVEGAAAHAATLEHIQRELGLRYLDRIAEALEILVYRDEP